MRESVATAFDQDRAMRQEIERYVFGPRRIARSSLTDASAVVQFILFPLRLRCDCLRWQLLARHDCGQVDILGSLDEPMVVRDECG